jgi:hypothetical protein
MAVSKTLSGVLTVFAAFLAVTGADSFQSADEEVGRYVNPLKKHCESVHNLSSF